MQFDDWQYFALTGVYVFSAAVVAAVYPYRRAPSPWKAIIIGISLPVIVSSVATTGSFLLPEQDNVFVSRGGEPSLPAQSGSFLDLLSYF
jgi:hypothetical protein